MPSGVNSFFISVCCQPAAGKTSLVPSVSPAACACFINTGRSANSSEEKMRSGFAALSADVACQVHGANLMVDVEELEDGDEGSHVVTDIGIVRIDAGDGDELALPVLDRE